MTATIYLGDALPRTSSGQPGCSGEQPSITSCSTLHRMGFAKPRRSPGALVVSYTTVSPLPVSRRCTARAVCFLWHWPAGYPEWALPTILLCGARTFLDAYDAAVA